MKFSDKLHKIIRDVNDEKWKSTEFYVTVINVVQIITRSISFFIEPDYNSLIRILICILSVFLMHYKIERKCEKLNEKINIGLLREIGSFILFYISIILIII